MTTTTYNRQLLSIPIEWNVERNEFYDIDPTDNILENDKFTYIYYQEDLLRLRQDQYHLDLGWYGADNLEEDATGFMLVLYRGQDWNNCELLELRRTKSKTQIVATINEILETVRTKFYADKDGYKISENDLDYRHIGQHLQFSVKNNISELMK